MRQIALNYGEVRPLAGALGRKGLAHRSDIVVLTLTLMCSTRRAIGPEEEKTAVDADFEQAVVAKSTATRSNRHNQAARRLHEFPNCLGALSLLDPTSASRNVVNQVFQVL